MKASKTFLMILFTAIMLGTSIVPAVAETVSNASVLIDNKVLSGDASPVYSDGIIFMPAKELAGALGGAFCYDHSTLTGTITLGENEVAFRLDDSIARYNGKYIQAPAPMKVEGNRFIIPAEFTSKLLGAEVCRNSARNQLLVFQPVNEKIVYRVVSGDSLWIVSRLFGTTITALKQMNSLTSDWLMIGQELIVKSYVPYNNTIPAQTIKNATLRGGAGFDYSPIGYVLAYTDISVTGKAGDWFKVVTPKGTGYMYYTVVGVKQDIKDTAQNSTYFSQKIPVDTSADYVTYSKYIVQSGDTLWRIAEKNGIQDYELAEANNISLSSMLYIGQALKIPVHHIPEKETQGSEYGEILDWFSEAQYVFPIGKVGKIIDVETGKSFMVQRTMGANHSDTETLTAKDTQTMKEIFGGSWTWDRRAFILEVDGRRLAVSIAGMPHAGVDSSPYMAYVSNRSDNYGYGQNLDRIKANAMDGHFDLYMLNCLRHKDNQIDPSHQYKVLFSGGLR